MFRAKTIAASISEAGKRVLTVEVEYPRIVHAENLTHRSLSKNSGSSRAIPTPKMLEKVEARTGPCQ